MTNHKASNAGVEPLADLDDLRREIDEIDRGMHALLMNRGEIIDRLIAVKARQGGGSAFRPAREAEMMRRLVSRHRGLLPLDTVEGIWRIIISTFTYVQAPYNVHADVSAADAPMRDSCRFHFGFTVPLRSHEGARAVIAAVGAAAGDLGLIRADDSSTPWWDKLTPPEAPKIIARLPFVERAGHAAGLPLYVVAKPLREAALHEVLLHAVLLPGRSERPDVPASVEIVASAAVPCGLSLVVAAPEEVSAEELAHLYAAAGQPAPHIAFVGSHAARFEIEPDTSDASNLFAVTGPT